MVKATEALLGITNETPMQPSVQGPGMQALLGSVEGSSVCHCYITRIGKKKDYLLGERHGANKGRKQ